MSNCHGVYEYCLIICSWCTNPEIPKLVNSTPMLPALQETKQLLQLPESYSVLVKEAAAFQCPQRLVDATYGDDGQATMLCLLCGTMLCTNSYCCQIEVEKENTMESEKRRIGGFTQHVQRYSLLLAPPSLLAGHCTGVVLALEWLCGCWNPMWSCWMLQTYTM